MEKTIQEIIKKYKADRLRLMDILLDIQEELGYIPTTYHQRIADELKLSLVDLQQTISFYHFFKTKAPARYSIYLNNSLVSHMMGFEKVKKALEEEVGVKFGNVTADGLISLEETSCIGMSDQEPAALINGVVFTGLTPFRVREIIRNIREGKEVHKLDTTNLGDGMNATKRVRATVHNNIRRIGPVLAHDYETGSIIRKIVDMEPMEVIEKIKHSNLRGRGGAGFPTGLKWEFCRKARDPKKYIFCNADEGEPGTFKDRVILTENTRQLFEGMAIAAYAVGADEGVLYTRYEYRYLRKHLEATLEEMRKDGLLGKNIAGKKDFDFDIRLQFGAGAYVCGEESALIESAEGKRGEPRDRPPFPVERGYLDRPTVVNNVETLASVVKIMLHGGDWFNTLGTHESTGTKLLSISGDCRFPGVYELEWGFSIYDILEMVGAENTKAVQVGGPSGALISPAEFRRILGYEDLATGGSLIIIDKSRDLLGLVVMNFTDFFIEESCGSCSLCRNLPVILRDKLKKILNGRGVLNDIEEMEHWCAYLKANRCGLGHTAGNPILSSIRNFRQLYEEKVQKDREFDSGFDLAESVQESCEAVGRVPNL